jgi:hypothetical protein
MTIENKNYATTQHFITIYNKITDTTQVMFLLPSRATPEFPSHGHFLPHQMRFKYSDLNDIKTATLLNIIAKCANTPLNANEKVGSFIEEITNVRSDRFFAIVSPELRDDVKSSVADGFFYKVSSLLHDPPEGFLHRGSFKTHDRYGNLQLTFFARPTEGNVGGGTDWVCDFDCDDAAGVEHIFQVVGNFLKRETTHPYAIHQILHRYQHIDTAYKLKPTHK